jgi:hypothetical protein
MHSESFKSGIKEKDSDNGPQMDGQTDRHNIHGYLLFLLRKERLNGPDKTMPPNLLNLPERGQVIQLVSLRSEAVILSAV